MIANHLFDSCYDCVGWNSSAILILENVRANTRFAPTIRLLTMDFGSFIYLTLIDDWDNNKVSLYWELFFSDRLIKGHI
jgi:hypothetical protein